MTRWMLVAAATAALACSKAGEGAPPAAPTLPTGSVAWKHVEDRLAGTWPVGAGTDAQGNRYLVTHTGRTTLRLQRFDAGGRLEYTKEWPAQGWSPYVFGSQFEAAVTAAGSVYVAASAGCSAVETCVRHVDLGGGVATDSVLVKLGPDGSFEWQRDLGGSDVTSIAANDEEVVVARVKRMDGSGTAGIERYGNDGTLLAVLAPDAFSKVVLDRDGDVVAGDGWGFLTKYARDGTIVFDRALDVGDFATAADGSIVVLDWLGEGETILGSVPGRGGYVLYVLEPQGTTLRFLRHLEFDTATLFGGPRLAVDPTGAAAVVGLGPRQELVVETYDLSDGAALWRRLLPDDGGFGVPLVGFAPLSYGSDHRLLVAFTLYEAIDVDGQRFTPREGTVLTLLLAP